MDELSEEKATGILKDIYEDIKVVLNVPMVNLIFRHIATYPGCLEWVWGALRTLYASGEIARMAGELLATVKIPLPPRLSVWVLRAVGVDEAGEKSIIAILDSYNRSNQMNLIGFSTLLALLSASEKGGKAGSGGGRTSGIRTQSAAKENLPRLLSLQEMDEKTRQIVLEINALTIGNADVAKQGVGSIYRHLAYWPGYLALATTIVQALDASGTLKASADLLKSKADVLAKDLASISSKVPDMPSSVQKARPSLEAELRFFTDWALVKVIPIGKVLRETMPQSTEMLGKSR